jgi:two-component system CheB/CheR fusion protein
MVLHEVFRSLERGYSLQIFATDLDERAIEVARVGLYPEGIAADVSPVRLKTFFTHEDGAYRVGKSIRDNIVFAIQNVISDPPFTRLDLIVCRNVLIYLDGNAQKRVLPNFHYALRPGGLLFLGSAETPGESAPLFDTLDSRHRILRRDDGPQMVSPPPGPIRRRDHFETGLARPSMRSQPQQVARQVTQFLLDRFVPCSVLVDENGTVVHVQGRSGMFLEPEQGPQRNNIVDMAREGLGPTLTAALREARQGNSEVVRTNISVRTNGGHSLVDVSVLPLHNESLRGHFLITMRTSPVVATERGGEPEAAAPAATGNFELEHELRITRENLKSTIEELETSNEELKSSNEELQSTNEELQSTNEELETSKEEMQSLNEELNTVNSELMAKVDALGRINDDMNNLLNSMQVAAIFLDTHLRVKRFTEQARALVRLINSDIGRPLSDLTSTLMYPSLIADCDRVLATLVPIETEVANKEGRWYLVRLIPYRTAENVIEGLVITVVDVDRTKKAEETLRQAVEQRALAADSLGAMMDQVPVGVVIVGGPDVKIRAVSRYAREMSGKHINNLLGLTIDKHADALGISHRDGAKAVPTDLPLARAALDGQVIQNEPWMLLHRDGSHVPVRCSAAPIRSDDGKITGAVMAWVEGA